MNGCKCNNVLGDYVGINELLYITQVLLHVSMHQHHLHGVLYSYFAEVTKIIKINKIRRLKCLYS